MTKVKGGFKRLAWSNLSAQFSEQLALAAAPLVAVLVLKENAVGTGLLQTAQTLPFLLLSLPAGWLADQYSHKKLMVGAEAMRMCSLLLIILLLALSAMTHWWLAMLGFLGVIGTVCYSVAAPALVPTLVSKSELPIANRWLELARSIAYAGGPAIGGAIVGWSRAPIAYALAALCSMIAISLLSGLSSTAVKQSSGSLRASLKEAVAFCFTHSFLRPIIVTGMVFSVSWFILQAVFVFWAISHLGITAQVLGMVLAGYGIGMITGAIGSPFLSKHLPLGFQILLGPTTAFLGSVLMLLTMWSTKPLLPGAAYFLFGAGPVIWSITTTSLRQAVTPIPMLGRVSGVMLLTTFGCRPVGALLGAVTASLFSVQACLLLSAVGFLLQLLVIRFSPILALHQLSDLEEVVKVPLFESGT
ncbi:MFS transporter [Spirosoma sp. BT702]|uniref:MFS transporter n=1 Tax=Spirosoma profusum TaxID=2771354 RepID=A0A926Y0Z9_9BACT|nr:MFS transporter [Spirosoma profusum]MBD2703906.1 MFS transporter [Spirosoma profusum]